MIPEIITSAQNPKIKQLLALQEKSRLRRETGLFVVEGQREIEHCLSAGYALQTLFYCPQIATNIQNASQQTIASRDVLLRRTPSFRFAEFPPSFDAEGGTVPGGNSLLGRSFEVSADVYNKVAYRGGTEGAIAIMKAKEHDLGNLDLCEDALICVLESVEKPGNLGAVLRSADAAGVDAVIICDPLTDIYNPNLIRASIGAVFTVPVACCSTAEAIDFLKKRRINILTAQLQDSEWYYNTPMTSGTAIVMGTEATGLKQEWRDAADAHIKIPMLGKLDSLNVSVSAAVLMYEAVRQRKTSAK